MSHEEHHITTEQNSELFLLIKPTGLMRERILWLYRNRNQLQCCLEGSVKVKLGTSIYQILM